MCVYSNYSYRVPHPAETTSSPQRGQPPVESLLTRLWRTFGRSPHADRAGLVNNADVVVWQSSRRLVMAVGLGTTAVLLRAAGVVSGPLWPILAIVPAYLTIVTLITISIERRHYVMRPALVALALADVAAIFVSVALVAAPAFYARALLLSLVALQFTQLFFVRTPALTVIVSSTIGYAGMLAVAWRRGIPVAWGEQGWLLAIYLLVALNGLALTASANRRLAALVDLFGRAQRGDFSLTFVEQADREPDGITMLGRAYNQMRSELATMVLADSLTGCFNRRGFDQVLRESAFDAGRRRGDLALLAIDIDHFKAINDSVGHLAGDAVLRELVALLAQCARAGDVVGRVGGEEFVMLLPGADGESAGVVAERVMSAVRAHGFRTARGRVNVTVSIGIAAEQITDTYISSALRARADEALYLAKRLGRDRVIMWAPGIRSNATPPWSDIVASLK
jgi:diguanylate cyclase (GGDEF)-like protein